jgi:hypothetical protein
LSPPGITVTSFLAYGITQNGEFMKIFHLEKNVIISAYRYSCMLDVNSMIKVVTLSLSEVAAMMLLHNVNVT